MDLAVMAIDPDLVEVRPTAVAADRDRNRYRGCRAAPESGKSAVTITLTN